MHLPERFDDIAAEDILRLVAEKTAECRTLEYKAKLMINTQDEKAEFLSDISSFANASGGEILFGITDERDGNSATGVPGEIVGLTIDTPASECNRVEQLIRDGIQPRLPALQVKAIEIPECGRVIVIRVGKSWIAPHMVAYANRTRFFSRNSSTGKVQLDVQQIGAAFAEQRAIGERLRDWKANRISKAVSGTGPVELQGSRLLFHFIPASAIAEDGVTFPRIFDATGLEQVYGHNIAWSWPSKRYNADGLLFVSHHSNNSQTYLQIFKEGMLEYGDGVALNRKTRIEAIDSQQLEYEIVGMFSNATNLLSGLAISEPIYTTLTLIGVKDRTLALPTHGVNFNDKSHPFDRDVILCPDVQIRNTAETWPFAETLLPIINSVWQAAGIEESPFIRNGQWQVANQNQQVMR